LAKADEYLAEYQRLKFSAFTFYEIARGFLASGAVRRLQDFQKVADNADIMPISLQVLRRASELWAAALRGGHPRGDADLIIAATALEASIRLVTGNTAHFDWIPGLTLDNWRL
jgi:tRNA(fMet)-specific endonuclease VapC